MKIVSIISMALAASGTNALKSGDDCFSATQACEKGLCCGYATPVIGGLAVRRCNKEGSSSFTDSKSGANYIYQCKARISLRSRATKAEDGASGLMTSVGVSGALMIASLMS